MISCLLLEIVMKYGITSGSKQYMKLPWTTALINIYIYSFVQKCLSHVPRVEGLVPNGSGIGPEPSDFLWKRLPRPVGSRYLKVTCEGGGVCFLTVFNLGTLLTRAAREGLSFIKISKQIPPRGTPEMSFVESFEWFPEKSEILQNDAPAGAGSQFWQLGVFQNHACST